MQRLIARDSEVCHVVVQKLQKLCLKIISKKSNAEIFYAKLILFYVTCYLTTKINKRIMTLVKKIRNEKPINFSGNFSI